VGLVFPQVRLQYFRRLNPPRFSSTPLNRFRVIITPHVVQGLGVSIIRGCLI